MLGLKETLSEMAKVIGLLWYRHVVGGRMISDNVLKRTLML